MTNHVSKLDSTKNAEVSKQRYDAALEACTEKQQKYIESDNVLQSYKRVLAEAFTSRSYMKVIKAKCLTCCCFEREEVRHCTVQICPLWNLRPYQDKTKQEDSEQEDE